jgi:hypothetical protein
MGHHRGVVVSDEADEDRGIHAITALESRSRETLNKSFNPRGEDMFRGLVLKLDRNQDEGSKKRI